jgi:predicted DNA-binding ribbon-helix-helix protein
MKANASKKRSMTIDGNRTSISLEDEFWVALNMLAIARSVSIAEFVTRVHRKRATTNLSSSVRVAILSYYQDLAEGVAPRAGRDEGGARIVRLASLG